MNKKGAEELLKTIFGLIIGILCLIAIVYTGGVLIETFFGSGQTLQANGQIERFKETINTLEEGDSTYFLLYAPEGWKFLSFKSTYNSNEVSGKIITEPSYCFGKNCVCICKNNCQKDKKAYCLPLDKPLLSKENLVFLEIKPTNLWVTENKESYELSLRNSYFTLSSISDTEKKEFDLFLESLKSQSYFKTIEDKSYSDKISKELVIALIYVDSKSNQFAVTDCGGAGIVGVLPHSAKFNNAQATVFEDASFSACKSDYAERLKTAVQGKSDTEKITLDERFNINTNLNIAFTEIKRLQDKYKQNYEMLVLEHYCGEECVENYCGTWEFNACQSELPTEIKNYMINVGRYYTYQLKR